MKRFTGPAAILATTVFAAALTASALAGNDKSGFKTSVASMLTGAPGVEVTPLISVADTLPSGFKFEALPDGIAVGKTNGQGTVDIFVNHETSLVPFPPTRSDFANSQVSKLRLHQKSAGVLKGEYVIPSSANYQRFCSNFLATKEHGFERDLLLTNEEATDSVYRTGVAWPLNEPADPRTPEQAGVVVALDVTSGEYRTIYGMGRHNHENSVAVPGYGYPVVLSGDDTFSAPSSQVYMYIAQNGKAVWNDTGALYALRSTDAAVNDYGDIVVGDTVGVEFIPVPRDVAVGGQAGLETWSNTNNVFQFIRIEDLAYDRTNPRIVYMADTGEPRAVPDAATGRLGRAVSGTNGNYMNGRIWKLELGANPMGGTLSILSGANFDLGGYANAGVVHQPDNVETTADALYIQEDTGAHNSSSPPSAYPAFPGATNARIWRYDLTTGNLTVVATVDQSALPGAAKGAWESSGIVDASSVFGPGAFLVDVQAHGWELETVASPVTGVNYNREAGQLLLLRVPGA